jgi:hypothetical protein
MCGVHRHHTLISWNHSHGSGTIPLKGFIRNIVSSFTTVNKYCTVVTVGLKQLMNNGFLGYIYNG